MHYRKIIALTIAVTAFTAAAHADIGKVGGAIGKIGSPVIPSNPPKATASSPADKTAAPKKEEADAEERKPLMVIPFNQRRVNFERNLDQLVGSNERILPGASYDVIAVIPSSGQSSHQSETYLNNLNAVTQEMQNAGIAPERIHSSTVTKDDVSGQEIQIYVGQ